MVVFQVLSEAQQPVALICPEPETVSSLGVNTQMSG